MSGGLHFVATGPDAYSVLDDLAMQRYTLRLERLHWIARDADGEQVGPGEQFRNDAFEGLRSHHDAPQALAA
jgi:hypothetical protein